MTKTRANSQTDSAPPAENAILESIADGVVVGDAEGKVSLLNQAAARALGVEGIAGKEAIFALFEPFPADGSVTVSEALDHLYADPYTHSEDETYGEVTMSVDERSVQVSLSPVLTDVGEFLGVVVVLRDVTQQARENRSRSRLLRAISHELRAPLTAIKGYSEVLLSYAAGRLDEKQVDFLRIIRRNSDRLVALVGDLLDISHADNGRLDLDLEPVQVETIIRDVANEVQPWCSRKGLHLTVEVEPGVGAVLGDRERLVQVVNNLARNACLCTREDGYVVLRVSRSGDEVRVDVSDTGAGFTPDEQEEIFQTCYRPDTPDALEFGSTGLELPISRMLIKAQGGRLWVESEPGRGAVFSFVLPPYVAPNGEGDVDAIELGEGYTVLVVEDDLDVSQLIELKLKAEGLDVIVTERGEEALELARTRDIDLITLDMMLPDIHGLEVLQRLKQDRETADIPVIVVSVLRPEKDGEDLGAVDRITKPFTLDRLMGSIRRALTVTS